MVSSVIIGVTLNVFQNNHSKKMSSSIIGFTLDIFLGTQEPLKNLLIMFNQTSFSLQHLTVSLNKIFYLCRFTNKRFSSLKTSFTLDVFANFRTGGSKCEGIFLKFKS